MRASELAAAFPGAADIPAAYRLSSSVRQREYLCGGELRHWAGELQLVDSPICDPTPGMAPRAIGAYPLLGGDESSAALAAATAAYDDGRGTWPTMPLAERIARLEAFVGRMVAVRDEVVRLIMWEIAKPLADAEKEFDRTVVYIHDTLEALKERDRSASRLVIEEGFIGQIRRVPLGVVLCMGPFNYPLNETFTTLIPALAMGNTAIFKPPKLGVLLHRPLLDAFREAFPPGVVNTVYGDGETVVGPLMRSGGIAILAFIGTSRVATILKHQHPKPHRLRCILGLEAKNAAIVLPDADLDLAVQECVLGALSFNGQRCTAIKILFVHRSIAEEFLDRLCGGERSALWYAVAGRRADHSST